MWPELHKLLSDNQIDEFDKKFSDKLMEFMQGEKLDVAFKSSFNRIYLPLSKWVDSKHSSTPLIIGINGAQGSGKSTLSQLLKLILEQLFNKAVLHLSIDDLYLSREHRFNLANTIHPLLKVRGVPGTHNVDLAIQILDDIKKLNKSAIKLPVFNKAIDDLLPEDQWETISLNVDIVLFEGWCVGAKPEALESLTEPLNKLEEIEDADACWRTYVNKQLAGKYQELFSHIDYLVMLKVPDMESVFEWRNLQEDKLKQKNENSEHTMTAQQLERFIMHFERITRQCLREMPDRADVLLDIDKEHQITRIRVQ